MKPLRIFLLATILTTTLGVAASRLSSQSVAVPVDPVLAAEQRNVEHLMQCRRQREAAEQAGYEATRRDQLALMSRVESGTDPVADAQAAAARGDFRLIRGISMVGTSALGVDCRTSHRNDHRGAPLTLGTRFYSDAIGPCEPPNPDPRCRIDALLDAYGPAYNRAIVSHPSYPYQDLCRPRTPATPDWGRYSDVDPADYGFPSLAPSDLPRDLYEAARRGTPGTVARMIAAASPGALDRRDPYGMTPLAWAVARRRPEIATLFLAAGADPLGGDCDDPARPESPLRLALRTGQSALARRFLRPQVVARVTPWPNELMNAAARGGATILLARMLREPHQGSANRLTADDGSLPATVSAVLDAYDRSLCWPGVVPAGAAIRMLGTYQSRLASRAPGGHQLGPVTVNLTSLRPAFLVLMSHEPVQWRVRLAPGARLAGVLALGMYRSTVTGDVRGVPVLINDQQDHCTALGGALIFAYEPGDQQLRLADALERMFGRPVADFQAEHNAASFEVR